jgi:hypothetical protein
MSPGLPADGIPSRNFFVEVVCGHSGQQRLKHASDLTRNHICRANYHHAFSLLKEKRGSGLQAVTTPESGR